MAGYIVNPWRGGIYPYPPFVSELYHWFSTSSLFHIEYRESGFPQNNVYFDQSSLDFLGRDVLLCSGLLRGPGTTTIEPAAWGFFIEHVNTIRQSPGWFRIKSDIANWDSRKIGLFAEDISNGIAGYFLWKHDEVVHIADAGPFIGKALAIPGQQYQTAQLKSRGIYGKNGGYKPDYFCLNKNLESLIVEVKGTIGPPSKLTNDIIKGKEQVSNVDIIGVLERSSNSRLVFASNLRREDENPRNGKDSALHVIDPSSDSSPVPVKVSLDDIVKNSYAKVLNFCGRHDFLHQFYSNDDPFLSKDFVSEFSQKIQNLPVFPIYRDYYIVVGLYTGVAIELFSQHRKDLSSRVTESLKEFWDMQKEFHGEKDPTFLLPNGVVITPNIEI